ncbi:MAG: dihydrodipicolinate synthase family protein [Bacillota bacterium]|nr:dihydrodipicolinate synthase family protein [Bacillota bacterium]
MISGIYAPVTTPFDTAGNIYWEKMADNMHWYSESPLEGLVAAGTNGEAALLDVNEKTKLYSFIREKLTPGKKLIVGTGCESTRETIKLNREAYKCGADAVLVLNPSYFKNNLDEDTLANHYQIVADSSPLPVILYNMPRNTNLNLSSKLVIKLAEHPNIIGIKDSSGNLTQIGEIIKNCRHDFAVFAGSASFLLPALIMGAKGGTLALANIMPRQCCEIYRLYKSGNIEQARKIQLSLLKINNAVTARWGAAGLKAALDLIGLYGGPPRLPLLPLSEPSITTLGRIMAELGLCSQTDPRGN